VSSKLALQGSTASTSASADSLYRKVAWHVMPLLVICYIANFIDRTNIGIAQIQMRSDLGFSDGVYGIGVSLTFLGFILFEVPSNLFLARFGARKTLLRIMVAWGLVSTCTMFVSAPWQFYLLRFLLGAAEAGFFPGALLYLNYWFPSSRRSRMTGIFFLGIPLAGIIGSPLSGWIMHAFAGEKGLHGWQWLFVLEGVPSVVLGILTFLILKDGPEKADWLSAAERDQIMTDLAAEQSLKTNTGHGSMLDAMRDPRVYVLGLIGACCYVLVVAVAFWSPLIIHASGVKDVLYVGLLGAIAPFVGVICMLVMGEHSDRTLERRWHTAFAWLVASAALFGLSVTVGSPWIAVILVTLMTAGHYCGLTVFWSIPAVYLDEKAKAAGIAMVTAMGSTAGAITPALFGWIRTVTGSLSLGLQLSAAMVLAGAVILLVAVPARVLREKSSRQSL